MNLNNSEDLRPIEERIMVILDENSEDTEREFIWVDKKWKEIIETITGAQTIQKEVVRSVVQFKSNIECDIEYADYIVEEFKKRMTNYRAELTTMYQTENDLIEEMYRDLSKNRDEVLRKVKCIKEEFTTGIGEPLRQLQKDVNNLNLYGFVKMLEAIERFNNMPDKDKEILSIAFSKYKEV